MSDVFAETEEPSGPTVSWLTAVYLLLVVPVIGYYVVLIMFAVKISLLPDDEDSLPLFWLHLETRGQVGEQLFTFKRSFIVVFKEEYISEFCI